jgi:hypothetical protein
LSIIDRGKDFKMEWLEKEVGQLFAIKRGKGFFILFFKTKNMRVEVG